VPISCCFTQSLAFEARIRSWVQLIQCNSQRMDTPPYALAPSVQRVRTFLVKNNSISCSWLHLLKVWSILKTRGNSPVSFKTLTKCL
jgi:hypothetical protein